jgi:hypothetical protein
MRRDSLLICGVLSSQIGSAFLKIAFVWEKTAGSGHPPSRIACFVEVLPNPKLISYQFRNLDSSHDNWLLMAIASACHD